MHNAMLVNKKPRAKEKKKERLVAKINPRGRTKS
jgi:hypothetical protein